MLLRAFIAAGVVWLAYLARDQFPAFVVGMIIAYVLSRPVSFLCHYTRMPRGLAILLIYLVTLAGAGLAIYNGGSSLAEQATSLFQNRQEIITNLIQQVSQATGWNANVAAVTGQILDKAGTFITAKPEELIALGGVVSRSLLLIIITLISSIYFLKDAEKIGAFCLRFVPEKDRDAYSQVTQAINRKFARYISGQFVLMAIMAILVYVIMAIYGLKYGLIVALVAGVAEVIPLFGPIAALVLAITIAASQLGLHGCLPVAGLLLGVRTLQDYLFIPNVIGRTMKLHPLVTLFFVMAGQAIDGGLGMLLGVPAAAAVNVLVDHFYPPAAAGNDTANGGKTGGDKTAGRSQFRSIWADAIRLWRRFLAAFDVWRRKLQER